MGNFKYFLIWFLSDIGYSLIMHETVRWDRAEASSAFFKYDFLSFVAVYLIMKGLDMTVAKNQIVRFSEYCHKIGVFKYAAITNVVAALTLGAITMELGYINLAFYILSTLNLVIWAVIMLIILAPFTGRK